MNNHHDIDFISDNYFEFDMNEDMKNVPIVTNSLKRKKEDCEKKKNKVQKNIFYKVSCVSFLNFLDRFCNIYKKYEKKYDDIEKWYLKQVNEFELESCDILYMIYLVIKDLENFVFIKKITNDNYKILDHGLFKRIVQIVFGKNKIETWIKAYNSVGTNITFKNDRLLFK